MSHDIVERGTIYRGQLGLKLKLHNRNEIEPHWAPGPSFPGFGSNTVRFSWPRVTGQVHLGHHSLYPPPVNSANGRRVGTTRWSAMPNTSAIIPWLFLNNSENFQVQAAVRQLSETGFWATNFPITIIWCNWFYILLRTLFMNLAGIW